MPALSTWSPDDGVVGAIAPLALAIAAGTALVVDLDTGGPRYPGSGSLAALVTEGPRRADLSPPRRGVAVLRNGGVSIAAAAEVVRAMIVGWPFVVLRLPARLGEASIPTASSPFAATVPVRLLVPGGLFGSEDRGRPAVYQEAGWRVAAPGPGLVVPRPRPFVVRALLEGRSPVPDRWLRSWRRVWEMPWA